MHVRFWVLAPGIRNGCSRQGAVGQVVQHRNKESILAAREKDIAGASLGCLLPLDSLHSYPSTCVIERSSGLVMHSAFDIASCSVPTCSKYQPPMFRSICVRLSPFAGNDLFAMQCFIVLPPGRDLKHDTKPEGIAFGLVDRNRVSLLLAFFACQPDNHSKFITDSGWSTLLLAAYAAR
jgi:hypothetical protein